MPKMSKITHNLLCKERKKSRYFCGSTLARILRSRKVYEVFHVWDKSELKDNGLNVKVELFYPDEDILGKDIDQEMIYSERSVFKAMNLLRLVVLTIWITTIPIVQFNGYIIMCVLIMRYKRQFLVLSPLLAMLDMFLKTNQEDTKFMKKVSDFVKSKDDFVRGCTTVQ